MKAKGRWQKAEAKRRRIFVGFVRWLLLLIILNGIASNAQVPQPISTNIFDQLAASSPVLANPEVVTATASFDPPVVKPGEKAIYRVTFDAALASVHWPEIVPVSPQLKIHPTASGQFRQATPTGIVTYATFTFDVRASAAGGFFVPELIVEVAGKPVTVPAAKLNVQTQILGLHEPVRQLIVEPMATNVFVGQPIEVRVLLPGSATHPVEGVSQIELSGEGFITEKTGARAMIQQLNRSGYNAPTFIYQTTITPIAAGELKVSAQGFTSGMQFNVPVVISGQVSIGGGQPRFVLLDSEPAIINVRPLPSGSELPGFTGVVGSFLLGEPKLSTNVVRVGETVQLTVIVHGQGNLNRISPPPPPRVKGWQVFPAERLGIIADPRAGISGAGFRFALMPVTTNVIETPAIPFSCFDPERSGYANLTIPPQPITVLPGQTNDESLAFVETPADEEKKLRLSKLAESPGYGSGSLVPLQMRVWMPMAQVSPALAFVGLWMLDRRRRYLEQHPDIVRRRKARRALRRELRELRRAETSGDAKRFVACAVNVLRIASAPHFPAEPRALVCGDVLEALGVSARSGRASEMVRKFFAAADAASYATTASNESELLNERESLREVLKTLEARL